MFMWSIDYLSIAIINEVGKIQNLLRTERNIPVNIDYLQYMNICIVGSANKI